MRFGNAQPAERDGNKDADCRGSSPDLQIRRASIDWYLLEKLTYNRAVRPYLLVSQLASECLTTACRGPVSAARTPSSCASTATMIARKRCDGAQEILPRVQ